MTKGDPSTPKFRPARHGYRAEVMPAMGQPLLLAGCRPEVAAVHGVIVAVGADARRAAGPDAKVIELEGEALPGLTDSHLHLEWLAQGLLTVDFTATRRLTDVLRAVRRAAQRLAPDSFVVGRGWIDTEWEASPHRRLLDEAAGGRPVVLRRRDGHSAWLSSWALARAGINSQTPDPPGGVIERDQGGDATGVVRETAVELAERAVPPPPREAVDAALAKTLTRLAALGLTSVHSMDPASTFASLQRLRSKRELPVRVTWNLPVAELRHAERIGLRSGWGDGHLRIWGVKAFLDGSLGSGTAQMLDGSGVEVLGQRELEDVARRAAAAELNVCLHAIGDLAVRRALDALEPLAGAWQRWRPRIEHAQCVAPDDMPRFPAAGAIASMQPIHAVADRDIADGKWGERTRNAYPWSALRRAGVVLAFGSDAPVESADPLLGLHAATTWRREVGWHAELALTRRQALAAYTRGAAYAVGLENKLGSLRPGMLCDVTVVDTNGVAATIVAGGVSFLRGASRKPRPASPTSGRGAR